MATRGFAGYLSRALVMVMALPLAVAIPANADSFNDRAPTEISGLDLPADIEPGEEVGTVLTVNGPPARLVRLQSRPPGGQWRTLATGYTDSGGGVSIGITALESENGGWVWQGGLQGNWGPPTWAAPPEPTGDSQDFRVTSARTEGWSWAESAVATVHVAAAEEPPAEPPADSCVQTDPMGRCSYSAVPYITGTKGDLWVDQNAWTGDAGYDQMLHSTSPREWYIIGNADTNFGGVLTFPNTGFWMTGVVRETPPVTSSWSVEFPHTDTTMAWAMYDLWFNEWADEVSIIVDLSVNDYYDCEHVATAEFDDKPWHLCVFGSQRVLKPGVDDSSLRNEPKGWVDIHAMILWLEDNGYLPVNSTWTAASFGFEVCDTGGVDQKFAVKDFAWQAATR